MAKTIGYMIELAPKASDQTSVLIRSDESRRVGTRAGPSHEQPDRANGSRRARVTVCSGVLVTVAWASKFPPSRRRVTDANEV
jgi:hypothetical protein